MIKKYLLLLLTAALVAGCGKEEESPFWGNDNCIAGFTLVKDGVTLRGAVSPDAIVISAPEQFSLLGAAASVTLSENATIAPDPSTVTDWNVAQTFTVTAYSGTKHVYAYRVERHFVSLSGDVTLLTQADVNTFAAELEAQGIDRINGTLTVGAATGNTADDTVTSLPAALGLLKVITGGVTVNATYAGETLTVFENLTTVGDLQIAAEKVKTVSFPKLAAVRASLYFNRATAVEDMDFPELTEVDRSFEILYADSLKRMHFPKLQQVLEDLTVQGRYGGAHKKETVDLPALKKVGGTLLIYYWQGVVTLTLPELTTVGGNFTVNNMTKLENLVMPKLETVGGDIGSVTNSPALVSMQFPALKSVGGSLTVPNVASLADLQFPALKYIRNELSVQSQSLTSLDAFSALDSIGGRLYLYNLANLASLDGLSSLKKVGTLWGYNLTIPASIIPSALERADVIYANNLTNVTEIDVRGIKVGTLELRGTTLTDLTLIGDDEFSGTLYLGNLPSGTTDFPVTIQGFKTVGGLSLALVYATAIDFPWLERITGMLDCSPGGSYEELKFANLRSVGGMQFYNLYSLETLELPRLEAITGYASGTAMLGFVYSSCTLPSLTLPELKHIEGNLTFSNTTSNAISFPALESITGTLTLSGSNIKDLNGFSKLTSVAGVTVSNFTQLKDFEPLKGVIPSLDAGAWNVSGCGYNPTYQDMVDGKYSN